MTRLSCVSVAGFHVSLEVLERLAYSRDELAERLPSLRTNSRASAVAVLSTCQRTEVYATWPDEPDEPGDAALLAALASDRGISRRSLGRVATTYHDEAAARHLLRVASGLESFVLGETEIAGQVRAAADIGRTAGGGDVVLDRLMDAAVSASRKRHRLTSLAATSRSVASVAIDAVVVANGGTVAGRRLVVVGAGNVAAVAVARAVDLGAIVTVCNRTRRSADRFVAAGAKVVDLADLADCLATNDIAILATAAPHPLVDAGSLRSARPAGAGPLTLVDLSLPRNVDPSVRALPSVRLIDLADLRAHGTDDARDLAGELAATEEVIEAELRRYLRWLESRSAATALRRMRRDAEDIAREELARITDGIAAEIHSPVEQALLRTVHRLVHGPTQELLAAARAGDTRLVNILAGLYGSSQAGDPDATTRRLDRPAFDARRTHACPFEQAADECGVHPAHEVAM